MINVVQVYNDDDVRIAVRSRDIRQRVGKALGRAYPTVAWLVDVNLAGGVVNVSTPAISKQYGMTVHLTHTTATLEQRVLKLAGELLERFNISRVTGNAGHIQRRVNGEAVTAARGEL